RVLGQRAEPPRRQSLYPPGRGPAGDPQSQRLAERRRGGEPRSIAAAGHPQARHLTHGPHNETAVGAHCEQPAPVLGHLRGPAPPGAGAPGTPPPPWPATARSRPRSSGTSSVLNGAGCARGSTGSGSASNPPTISPPRAGRRYTAASTTLVIGPAGSTSGAGAVMSSWWRTGATGTRAPASPATRRPQPPPASTTP